MKCELCGRVVGQFDPWVPVFPDQDPDFAREVWPFRSGVHLDCIKEMLDVLRSATLAMAPSTETEALTGETNGT